jgi:hypothetical protein
MESVKQKAEELVNSYRIILMNEDTECGNEILCTSIAKQCAIITVDFALDYVNGDLNEAFDKTLYLLEVKQEIEKL